MSINKRLNWRLRECADAEQQIFKEGEFHSLGP